MSNKDNVINLSDYRCGDEMGNGVFVEYEGVMYYFDDGKRWSNWSVYKEGRGSDLLYWKYWMVQSRIRRKDFKVQFRKVSRTVDR